MAPAASDSIVGLFFFLVVIVVNIKVIPQARRRGFSAGPG